jgi:anthranilate synthase component 1
VADSDPVAEDEECLNKARAVLSAVATAATLAEPGSEMAATFAEPEIAAQGQVVAPASRSAASTTPR